MTYDTVSKIAQQGGAAKKTTFLFLNNRLGTISERGGSN